MLLNFESGKQFDTGVSYSSQETDLAQHKLTIRTYENKKVIKTVLTLEGTGYLKFRSQSDDPRIPVITGQYWSNDYEDCVLSTSLTDKNVKIDGVVSKLDSTTAISTKTLTNTVSGKIIAVMKERIELITESDFNAAIRNY